VRRHVLRVGSRRGDLGVTAGGAETELGERRSVGGVNDVVRQTGVTGVPGEQRFQQGDRPALLGEGGIGLGRRGQLAQRVVDRDLDVPGKLAIEPRHGIGVGLEPGRIGRGLGVTVERRGRGDEPALPGRLYREGRRPGCRIGALAAPFTARPAGERIAPGVERDAQYAMAQVESASRTSPKARSPSSHQKEWSTAMACSKRRWAAGVQETGKVTRPNLPTW
jgi:hypothetical protein